MAISGAFCYEKHLLNLLSFVCEVLETQFIVSLKEMLVFSSTAENPTIRSHYCEQLNFSKHRKNDQVLDTFKLLLEAFSYYLQKGAALCCS